MEKISDPDPWQNDADLLDPDPQPLHGLKGSKKRVHSFSHGDARNTLLSPLRIAQFLRNKRMCC